MISSNRLKRPVAWHLRDCMRQADIRTATDLHNRIKAIDPDAVKYAQLSRIIDSPPVQLNLQTLTVLTIVLDCRPGDILDPRPEDMVTAKNSRNAGA